MAKNNKADMSCARVKKYTAFDVSKAERHNERKNESYENMNVIEERIPYNVHFKKPFAPTYMEQLKQMEADGLASLRGLRKDATLFNEKWTPSNVSRNSMKVVWWKCGAGHSYRAKITDRTIEQKGCPQCEAEFQQALPQMLIMMYGAQNGITVKSNSDSELGMRLVAYLPELHCAVDIAGATVTEKREQSVKAHICQSNRLGYYLIKRTADASQMAAEIKTLFIRNHIYLHTDSEKDVQVLRERFLEWKYRNACKLNGKY